MSKGKKRIALGGFFQELGKTFMLPVALIGIYGVVIRAWKFFF